LTLHFFRVPAEKEPSASKNAAEMIYCILDKRCNGSYDSKNSYMKSREDGLSLKVGEHPGQPQKFEDEKLQYLLVQDSTQTS